MTEEGRCVQSTWLACILAVRTRTSRPELLLVQLVRLYSEPMSSDDPKAALGRSMWLAALLAWEALARQARIGV